MKDNIYVHLLKHRSFMAFWGATTFLRLASNILQFALAIYVLDLTGSAFVYSTVLSIIILPRILCSSLAGYLADFRDSVRILRWGTFSLVSLMTAFLTIHIFATALNVPLIYVLVSCLELCETFLAPTEGKTLLCIVTEEEIAPASKISSLDDGVVEILAPAVASVFYGWLGLSGILGITIALEIIAFLLAVQIRKRKDLGTAAKDTAQVRFSLRNIGIAYQNVFLCLKEHPYVLGIILFAPLFNFFINPLFSIMVPYYFRVTLQTDVDMYAMFQIILGGAGLLAPFLSVGLINDRQEYKANKAGTVISAAVLLCLSGILYIGDGRISANVKVYTMIGAMALLVMVVTIMNIATSITIKKHIPGQIMGRVITIIQLCATISVPLGQLFYGICTDKFSVSVSCLISVFGLAAAFEVMVRTYREIDRQ